MPVMTLKMARGRPTEKKRAFVQAVTKAAVETLDVKPEWVTVLIDEYDRENWATGGELHSDQFGNGETLKTV
jgi:4-oxalocrotonate tautomerase